jgi:hypothetical protein
MANTAAPDDARDIYIGIGDAIGGAIILNGTLWTGASGCAGEIGPYHHQYRRRRVRLWQRRVWKPSRLVLTVWRARTAESRFNFACRGWR